MSNGIKFVLTFTQVEIDTILALTNNQLKQYGKLKAKHIKKLNAISGENYVQDYVSCLKSIKEKCEGYINL